MERPEEPSLKRIRASRAVSGRDSDGGPDEKAMPVKGEASSRDSPDLKRMRVEGVSSSDSDDDVEVIEIVAYLKANHLWSSDDEKHPLDLDGGDLSEGEVLSEEEVLGEQRFFFEEEVDSEELTLTLKLDLPGKSEVWKKYVAVSCDSSDDEEVFNTDDLIVRTYQKPNLDEEETEKILKQVEECTARLYSVDFRHGVPDKPFFLLSIDSNGDNKHSSEERSLDIYYKYLFPNTPSALSINLPFYLNKLPEEDFQYELLYDNLDKCNKIKREFISVYCKTATPERRQKDYCIAKDMAKRLQLKKLCNSTIHLCIKDLFLEWDVKAAHKFREEYDIFLLECRYNPKLQPEDFKSVIPPVGTRLYYIDDQPTMFDMWMNEIKGMEMPKEACQELIREKHAKNLSEDLSTRIRYIKYKRSAAKRLGLI